MTNTFIDHRRLHYFLWTEINRDDHSSTNIGTFPAAIAAREILANPELTVLHTFLSDCSTRSLYQRSAPSLLLPMSSQHGAVITISVRELKSRFSEYLNRVTQSKEIVITSHGKEVARLVSPHSPKRRRSSDAQLITKFRALPWFEPEAARNQRYPSH